MAEVYKKPTSMWAWIIGVVLAILLIWLLWNWMRPAPVVTEAPPASAGMATPAPATTPPVVASAPAAAVALAPVALIIAVPADYFDREVSGTAKVGDVPTDRGFYLQENDRRVFAILGKNFTEKQVDINPGQTVMVSGVVRPSAKVDEAEVGTLQAATLDLIKKEPVYLVVRQVEIIAR